MRLFVIDMKYCEKYVEFMFDIRLINNILSIYKIFIIEEKKIQNKRNSWLSYERNTFL